MTIQRAFNRCYSDLITPQVASPDEFHFLYDELPQDYRALTNDDYQQLLRGHYGRVCGEGDNCNAEQIENEVRQQFIAGVIQRFSRNKFTQIEERVNALSQRDLQRLIHDLNDPQLIQRQLSDPTSHLRSFLDPILGTSIGDANFYELNTHGIQFHFTQSALPQSSQNPNSVIAYSELVSTMQNRLRVLQQEEAASNRRNPLQVRLETGAAVVYPLSMGEAGSIDSPLPHLLPSLGVYVDNVSGYDPEAIGRLGFGVRAMFLSANDFLVAPELHRTIPLSQRVTFIPSVSIAFGRLSSSTQVFDASFTPDRSVVAGFGVAASLNVSVNRYLGFYTAIEAFTYCMMMPLPGLGGFTGSVGTQVTLPF